MNNDPPVPTPEPATTPVTPPTDPAQAVGLVDRSHLQSVYPDPSATPPLTATHSLPNLPPSNAASAPIEDRFSAFDGAGILVSGLLSACSIGIADYLTKNVVVALLVSSLLSVGTIVYAVRSHRKVQLPPLAIVGLAAATISLVTIVNALLLRGLLLSSLY